LNYFQNLFLSGFFTLFRNGLPIAAPMQNEDRKENFIYWIKESLRKNQSFKWMY